MQIARETLWQFFGIVLLTIFAALVALPPQLRIQFSALGVDVDETIQRPALLPGELRRGLDIQGGLQVVLATDMRDIPEADRLSALRSVQEVIRRRVDAYGISEPTVQTARAGEAYRIIVELPGLDDPRQALQLIGSTAQLEFRLQDPTALEPASAAASASDAAVVEPSSESAAASAAATLDSIGTTQFTESFQPTGLTGRQLKRATVQFQQQTNEPVVALEFDNEGRQRFAEITENNVNGVLGVFLDGAPVMLPQITTPILNGQAQISGGFTPEQAEQLAIQLNAGALPVPVEILEQRTVGASLGEEAVQQSVRAGLVGLLLVIIFMIGNYGFKGVISAVALGVYAVLTVASYKLMGVVLTVPGIAGLLLTIGMAVDANILIFERMKEERRAGRGFAQAMELGFGRAWDSIKDANLATICTALVLINPLNFSFLNTSGVVRGFGITLLIGVLISLFTGVVTTRILMRIFLAAPRDDSEAKGAGS